MTFAQIKLSKTTSVCISGPQNPFTFYTIKDKISDFQIWMLTGDKKETAINLGHSAGIRKESEYPQCNQIFKKKGRKDF